MLFPQHQGLEPDRAFPFLREVADTRQRARQYIRNAGSRGAADDDGLIVRLLTEILSAETLCLQRYRQRLFDDAAGATVEAALTQQIQEAQSHVEMIAARIRELGGSLDGALDGASAVPAFDLDEETLTDLLAEDLIAERIAIDSYREIIAYLGSRDATTRSLLESFLIRGQQHAEELARIRRDLLAAGRAPPADHPTPTLPGALQ